MPEPAPPVSPVAGPLVLYDGHCGLCDRSVRWLIDRDPRAVLRFAPLQGETAAPILVRHGVDSSREFSTMLVVENLGGPNERLRSRSDGALAALSLLGGTWRALAVVARWVPRWLRDRAYDFVARRRFRWFGRLEACRIPTAAERARFMT